MTSEPSARSSNIIVASHERSGTHFLINTLALNFGFDARWIDSDIAAGADFYLPSHFRSFLECIRTAGRGRLIKEHHHFAFFDGLIEQLRRHFIVFYVYRNPADVMCSYWRYVHAAERREGPLCATVADFMRAAPAGGMLRYQMQQHATVLDRWRSHVDAWTTPGVAEADVVPIRYEDLNLDFAATVARLAARLGVACPNPVRPSPARQVMVAGPGKVGGFRDLIGEEDVAFIRARTQATLSRLDLDRYLAPIGG
jgi:hypothetical protein